MKRWALVTVGLYLACMTVIATPLFFLWVEDASTGFVFLFSFLAPLLVVAQVALLAVPVAMASGRPIGRRSIRVSAALTAIPMVLMVLGFVLATTNMVFGEDVAGESLPGWVVVSLVLVSWVGWGLVFHRSYTADDPDAFVRTVVGWLLKGSILEVLVSIPSHVIARRRNECCAPDFTMLGLVAGLSVALLSFGPGVFFLFAERVKSKRRAAA